MLLSGEAIKQRALIQNGSDSGYRGASYDLHIGAIIQPGGSEQTTYTLPAQGIVAVISEETVDIPTDIAGFAMVKTSLCKDGILAINIGVIDPLYSGPVSSFLINFGRQPYLLESGQVFLRLVFFEYRAQPQIAAPPTKSVQEYVLETKLTVVQRFSATFLDLPTTIRSATKDLFSQYRRNLFFWVPAFALLLTMLAFLLNYGNLLLVQGWLQPSDQTKAELLRVRLEEQERSLSDRNRALEERLNALGAELTDLRARIRGTTDRVR